MRILTIILSLVCVSAFAELPPSLERNKDSIKVYETWKVKADQGDAYYQRLIKKFEDLKVKAEQGDAQVQCCLGMAYLKVLKDPVEAVKWFRKSADQGDPGAQWLLGVCYMDGGGVLKDPVEAYAYFNLGGVTYLARKDRDILEKEMTPSQIEAGIKRSKELQKEIEAKIAAKGEKK